MRRNSSEVEQGLCKSQVFGSIPNSGSSWGPVPTPVITSFRSPGGSGASRSLPHYAALAQMVERRIRTAEAVSSILTSGSIRVGLYYFPLPWLL